MRQNWKTEIIWNAIDTCLYVYFIYVRVYVYVYQSKIFYLSTHVHMFVYKYIIILNVMHTQRKLILRMRTFSIFLEL